ncbi:MAG: alpha-hydroxy acid oxidase [Solirubrobacteraceae bacterium]
MNELAALVQAQLRGDLKELPERLRVRLSDSGRAARCGTIGELRHAARRSLPRAIFDFVDGAAGDEVTAQRNLADLREVTLRPRALVDVSHVELGSTVLGEPVDVPLLAAPMGLLGLIDPSGELALARALHAVGSICVVGAMASYALEELSAAVDGPLWFQTYMWRDRGLVQELLTRARACGHRALVLTVDVPVAAGRDRDRRNGFGVPPRLNAPTLLGGALHPRWSCRFAREPRLRWANVADPGGDPATAAGYINAQFDPAASWEAVSWFRERWDGPLVVKGLLDAGDAAQAVRLGAAAVAVSNHGGRQLDHAPSTISALPAIVQAVGGEAEVYLDGGIRRGSDVLKALALGARACLLGRSLVYGLGAAGAPGVLRAVEILRDELRGALALAGVPSVRALDPSCVSVPERWRAAAGTKL